MYRAQMLDLVNGDTELGTFETEGQAREAIAAYRNRNNLTQSARIVTPNRWFFVY